MRGIARLSPTTPLHDLAGHPRPHLHALLARSPPTVDACLPPSLRAGTRVFVSFFTRPDCFGPFAFSRDERQIDLSLHGGRKLNLARSAEFAQPAAQPFVAFATQVEAFVF